MKIVIALVLMAGALCGQTTTTPVTTAPVSVVTPTVPAVVYPSYFVTFGGEYTRNASPQAAAGFVSGAIGLGGGIYSITTVDMTAATSTIRSGFGKVFSQSGNFILLGRVDAGVSTVTPVIGSFAGGFIVGYNLGGRFKSLQGVYAVAEFRVVGATSTTSAAPNQVTPGLLFGISKGFK